MWMELTSCRSRPKKLAQVQEEYWLVACIYFPRQLCHRLLQTGLVWRHRWAQIVASIGTTDGRLNKTFSHTFAERITQTSIHLLHSVDAEVADLSLQQAYITSLQCALWSGWLLINTKSKHDKCRETHRPRAYACACVRNSRCAFFAPPTHLPT